ncbi:MAG: hypothetical protein A2V93_11415 [Ignavibacteria bacterium RBG_16_34_14]|nr:MAG: hypothetical protein A2V93_11415 [Ignavibacteria bacterium RBG_16_34_14]
MTFKHIIGKSTFRYGFTIPKKMYSNLTVPEKGNRRKINLVFGDNQTSIGWLCRLNNSPGHLQIRYDGKFGNTFSSWLKNTFKETFQKEKPALNEFIEVQILNNDNFLIKGFPISSDNNLFFSDIIIHKLDKSILSYDQRILEIIQAVRNIPYEEDKRQMHYNLRLKEQLSNSGWLNEQKVVNDNRIKLKCDYRKEYFQLEAEFGNARTYYQDIVKFVMSYNSGLIKLGGLIVPSTKFARHLCVLGSSNAYKTVMEIRSKYSGMMDFNKAKTEFPYIKNIFNIPFIILSLDYRI